MTLTQWMAGGVAATIGLMPTVAIAQDVEGQEEQAEVVQRPKLHELTVGLTSFRSNYSINQYATPIDGFGLHSLSLLFPWQEGGHFARFIVRGMPDQDSYVSGLMLFNNGRTSVRADRREFGSYVLDWRPKQESGDKATSVTIEHSLAPGIGAFATYRSDKRDGRYPASMTPDLTQTQTVAGGVGGSVLGGNAKVAVTERRTYTGTGVQPTTLHRVYTASYRRDIGDTLNLGAIAELAQIDQAGLQGSDVNSYALNGMWDLAPSTYMSFQLSNQKLNLNNIQNAYVRERSTTSARLYHRLQGWSLQLGFKHMEEERVRADQTFVDVPITNAVDFRAAGRMGDTRLTLRGKWEDLSTSAVMQTDDARQLYWDNKAMLQAKVEGSGDAFVAYGVYTYRYRQNEGRAVEIDWHNVAMGASYFYDETLNGYAELSFDEFGAKGNAETGQALDFYFPNAWNFAVGVDWARGADLYGSANLNYFESGDVRGTMLTFNVRYLLSDDNEIEVVVAPWARDDRQFDLTGFRTTFLSARYTVRF